MPRRICLDCGRLTSGAGRCDQCAPAHKARRATYEANRGRLRGSGWARQAALAELRERVRQTGEPCYRCGQQFEHLGQVTGDHEPALELTRRAGLPPGPLVPSHRSCNSSHGARLRNELRHA